MNNDNVLPGFESLTFCYNGATKTVFRRGQGPGVVVMHEIPGITPQVREFAERVASAGFTVFMPHLFGTPNKPLSGAYMGTEFAKACISKEFTVFASGRSSPITDWLRCLVRDVHAELGGPGVGAIGMCLTGGFALTLMVESAMIAPVLSQPSLPMPVTKKKAGEIDMSPADLATVKQRVRDENLQILGLRFTEDFVCPAARFDRLREEFGDHFEAIEIDSSKSNAFQFKKTAHSVVTTEFVDESGHPTREAMDRVIEFYNQRLKPA